MANNYHCLLRRNRVLLTRIAALFISLLPFCSDAFGQATLDCGLIFDPAPGDYYSEPIWVNITDPRLNSGGEVFGGIDIRFTTDGSDPTLASPVWPGPQLIKTNMLLRAALFGKENQFSAICTARYGFNWDFLELDPAPNPALPFTNAINIHLSAPKAPADTLALFTLDGTEPTGESSSVPLNEPIRIEQNAHLRLKLYSAAIGAAGITHQAEYTFTPAPIQVSPVSGQVLKQTAVTITCSTPGSSLFYSTSAPLFDDPQFLSESDWLPYTSPLMLTNSVKLFFRATKPNFVPRFATAVYEIQRLPQVIFTPPTLADTNAIFLTMACENQEAKIHYTLDGSEPTEDSPLYEGPLRIEPFAKLRAKAFHELYQPSFTHYKYFKPPGANLPTNASFDEPSPTATYVTQIDLPVWLTSARDGTGRLFVCHENGLVFIVGKPHPLFQPATPFLSLPIAVYRPPELAEIPTLDQAQGNHLVSIAFPPDYDESRTLFVSYFSAGIYTIESFTTLQDPDQVDEGSGQILFQRTWDKLLEPPGNSSSTGAGGEIQALPSPDCVNGQLVFDSKGNLYVNFVGPVSPSTILDLNDDLSLVPGKFLKFDFDSRTLELAPAVHDANDPIFEQLLTTDCLWRGALKVQNSDLPRSEGIWLLGFRGAIFGFRETNHQLQQVFVKNIPLERWIAAAAGAWRITALAEGENGAVFFSNYGRELVPPTLSPQARNFNPIGEGSVLKLNDDLTSFKVRFTRDSSGASELRWFSSTNLNYNFFFSDDLVHWSIMRAFRAGTGEIMTFALSPDRLGGQNRYFMIRATSTIPPRPILSKLATNDVLIITLPPGSPIIQPATNLNTLPQNHP